MDQPKKIVFLYSELAGYVVSCFNELAKRGHQVTVVRWQLNKEAPFKFDIHSSIDVREKDSFTKLELLDFVRSKNPNLLFVSGWMDKDYTFVAKKLKTLIPVITGIDNQWYGTSKQKLGSVLSKFLVQDKFTHAFVAGDSQMKFALKMGFPETNIIKGLYSADTSLFESYYEATKDHKQTTFPKRFLYVGRYVEWKGIFEMWNAFIDTFNEYNHDWELWCVGTGELYDRRIEHHKIKHFGFVQPSDLQEIISETGVFILPSKYEPWGVVTQEYASAGYPMISNKNVGSASTYIKTDNGLILEDASVEELKNGFKQFIDKSDDELVAMMKKSHAYSKVNSPKIWSDRILSVLND